MTELVWALIGMAAALTAVAAVGVLGVRILRQFGTSLPYPDSDRSETAAREQEHDEQALATLRAAADEASAAVTAARAEAAEASTEASTLRAQARRTLDEARADADALLARARRQAEQDAEQLRSAARRNGEREIAALRATVEEQLAEAERRERRLAERERAHAQEAEQLLQRAHKLRIVEAGLAEKQAALASAEQEHRAELERVAGLTAEAARAELVACIEEQAKREAAVLVRDIETEARRTGERRARHIVADSIQRVASEQTTESVVSMLHLPSDEMKGRIIGREGRNIRAFESITGVNLIIDDTPEAVLLSCFDPVRRETGRVTLEKLVLDGRIHPHRIEEVYQRAQQQVDGLCQRAAEDALVEVGITDLHPELVTVLGRLRYRTSYGQNVLKHLVETAHLAGLMAAELGLDQRLTRLSKRAAFLHDVGKALTHELEGSHAKVGADLARRYGESEEVVHAIEAHHSEITAQTIEAVLTQAADACSGGRPGARREGLESYVRRLERIERIAAGKPGVDKVFAMQAGREVRVMVRPEQVDDIGAAVLARDVAKQVEEELTYPGQVRITVVRELRAVETAR